MWQTLRKLIFTYIRIFIQLTIPIGQKNDLKPHFEALVLFKEIENFKELERILRKLITTGRYTVEMSMLFTFIRNLTLTNPAENIAR